MTFLCLFLSCDFFISFFSMLSIQVARLSSFCYTMSSFSIFFLIPSIDDVILVNEYNSILLHFVKLWQYVFFLFQSLDLRASDKIFVLARFFNRISCNKGFKKGLNKDFVKRPLIFLCDFSF